MKYCEKCLVKNGNFDFFVMTLQTSYGTIRQRKRVMLQTSCGAERAEEEDRDSKYSISIWARDMGFQHLEHKNNLSWVDVWMLHGLGNRTGCDACCRVP